MNSLVEKHDEVCLNSLFLTNNNISEAGMEEVSIILVSCLFHLVT